MKKQIRRIIEKRLTELAERDQVWRPEWVALEVTRAFEDVDGVELGAGEGSDFWRYCGYRTVRALVAEAIRKRTDPSKARDDQLVFEGFPRVQAYYDIKREGEWLGVPVLQLTGEERTSKVAELRRTGEAMIDHADQLELFFRASDSGIKLL